MQAPYNWAILGAGRIAHTFVQSMRDVRQANLYAVGSRDVARAQSFASQYNINVAYGDYLSMMRDEAIDIVYVATPHSHHHACVMLALEHGKHVLCEKPLTISHALAKTMFDKAHTQDLHLMEAMWTRFLPVWQQVKRWIDEGLIGDIRMMMADFTHRSESFDPTDRKFDKALAGGALLDIGVYPIALANFLLPEAPSHIASHASFSETGVDMQSSYLLHYANGAQAVLAASFETHGTKTGSICGVDGMIQVKDFWKGDTATIERYGQESEVHHFPITSNGMQYQAIAMMQDIAQGKQSNNVMPPQDSLLIAQIMDDIREIWENQHR